MIRKFRTTVIREDEYIIEIDDELFDQKKINDYCENFSNINTYEGHAENLAWHRMMNGTSFYEGYGHVLHNGKNSATGYMEKGINIKVISEEDIDVLVSEITTK